MVDLVLEKLGENGGELSEGVRDVGQQLEQGIGGLLQKKDKDQDDP